MTAFRARLLIALLCVISCLCSLVACRDQAAWIKKMGFTPLTPPSQLLSPGALIMRKNQFGKMKLLCTAEESLGPDFKPSKSRTVGGRYRRGSKIGWRIKGDALKQIQVAANAQDIEEIFVQVENAKITALTDVDVLLNAAKRSPACEAAVKRREAEGWDISLISQALTADVSYSVQFSSDGQADVSARLAQLQAVSVTLGGSFKATSESSASAKGLCWGLKDDAFLGSITSKDADVQALRGQSPVPSKRASLFLPEETIVAPAADKFTQTDDDSIPAWGVTTDESAASPVPGMDDAMNDALSDDNPADTPGFVPQRSMPADTQIDDGEAQNPSKPISPRSRHLPGDVLGATPAG